MANWVARNGLHYIKTKEPVRGSKKYLRPKDVGMDPKGYKTKEEAMEAEKELKRRVKEMYSQTSTKIPLELLVLTNLWLKSYEGQVSGHDTLKKKIRFCKEIYKLWGNILVTEIRVFMVQQYLDDRAKRFSANSYNAYRKEGVSFFNWLIDQELVPDGTKNVFQRVKKMQHDTKAVQPAPIDDVVAVWNVANESQRDILVTIILMGARKNEVFNLKWEDIDFEERTYKLHTRKSGRKGTKTTLHTISDELMEILLRRLEMKHPEVEYVFWHRYYSHAKKTMVEDGYKSLNKFTKRLCLKAGVKHFALHQLRHLAASILKKEGASIAELQRFLRHDEQKTTEIYAGHLDNGTKAQNELVGRMWSEKIAEAENNNGCV